MNVNNPNTVPLNESVEFLNYQKSILHPSLIDEVMTDIKGQLTTTQMMNLINGDVETRQFVAQRVLSQINQTLETIKATHSISTTPQKRNNANHSFQSIIESASHYDTYIKNISTMSLDDDESTQSEFDLRMDPFTQSQSENRIQHKITAQQILEHHIYSRCILDFMDDIAMGIYAQINQQCHHNSTTGNRYILINRNDWFSEYVQRHQHATKHMVHCKMIIFDFTHFDNTDQDFLMKTFEQMKKHHIFENCFTLNVISPSTETSRVLSEHIGCLSCVKELIFEEIEIFPMIKIITQIPSESSTVKRLSMRDIHIKRRDEDDFVYEEQEDEWMKRNLDANCTLVFLNKLLQCDYVEVSGWRNEGHFWNEHWKVMHRLVDCSDYSKLHVSLQRSLRTCPIKELIYLPTAPNEDRIPYKLFKFMLQFKGNVIEKLQVDFAGSGNLYLAVMNKKLTRELKMSALKELDFGWDDRKSYKFLNLIIEHSAHLNTVNLRLPSHRLSKPERRVSEAVQLKCDVN
eukprot:376337_1